MKLRHYYTCPVPLEEVIRVVEDVFVLVEPIDELDDFRAVDQNHELEGGKLHRCDQPSNQ